MKKVTAVILLTSLIFACAPHAKKMAPAQAPAMTQEEMQKNFMAAGEVRPEHAALKNMAGNWKVDAKFWMNPDATPEVSKGTASAKLVYGGRYLVQNYKGSMMGKPFEGQGVMGFDNLKAKYVSTWFDSMSTMMVQSEGVATSNDAIVLASSMTCPMTKESVTGEDVYTFVDKDHFRLEAFQNKDGKKIKGMEILYSRIKHG